jgi:hypothetical protein
MFLYHGTTERLLPKIVQHGIRPRKYHDEDNWGHSVSSNQNCVYLTVAYALYFAHAALKDDADESRLVVFEIDSDMLRENLFCPDEDFLAQANVDPTKNSLPMREKNEYYKKIVHQYLHEPSLKSIGNCAYKGIIPIKAINRIAFISHKAYFRIFMSGYDPMISIMNFRVKGEEYMKSTKWLFDPDEVPQEYTDFPNPYEIGKMDKIPSLPIPDSREGIEVFKFSEIIANYK